MNRILGLLTPTIFCLLIIACLPLPCLAQSSTATLSGTVEDEKGAVVPGASVSVADPARGLKRTVTTNENGSFTVPLLPPSTYTVTVEQSGFAPVQINEVVLNVHDQRSLLIQLKVGQVGAAVEVNADANTVRDDPAVATVVNRQFVENLPLNGRSFQALIELTPGVVLSKATSSEPGQFNINGQRSNANYFTVDGVSANINTGSGTDLGQGGGGSLPGFSALGGTSNLVSVDALQEFRIQTSTYAPEFGRTPGGQISIVTRSGTNDFHGSVFDYVRNDVFDANDYFANRNGLKKPPLRQNDFGGVLGGPLYLPRFGEGGPALSTGKDRTFFFFSYEGLRLRQPRVGITSVPSLRSRQIAPPQIQPFLKAFPLPNGPDLGNDFAQFSASYSDPSTLNATSIRIDHTLGKKLTVFGRYNYSPSNTSSRINNLSTLSLTDSKTHTLTLGTTQVITSSISNDFRANYSKVTGGTFFRQDNFGGATILSDSAIFPSSASSKDSVFAFFLGNTGFNIGKNANNLQRQINLVDNLSVVTGAHQLKFGADYRRLFPVFSPLKYDQIPIFSTVAQVLSGIAPLVLILGNDETLFPVFTNFSLYGQDTWRATPRLTLTYGLRWEVNPAPKEKTGNDPFTVTGLDNPSTIALAPRGTPLYKTTYNNFAPRVGVAYQLSQKSGRETVLRGGFGIFYDLGTGPIATAFGGGGAFPYSRVKFLFGVPFPLTAADATPPTTNLNAPIFRIFVAEPNLKLPRTYQWNLALEQSIGVNQTVSATYVGAVGRRLLLQELIANPNPNFQNVFVTRNAARSDYHALQLQFQRRLSRGLQALASYTWSHSIDNVSNEDPFSNVPFSKSNPDQERGPSNFDIRHTFTAAATYNIPAPSIGTVGSAILGGWSIDPIFRVRSATPVNVVTGRDIFSQGLAGSQSVSRPDLISGVPLYINDPLVAGGRRINRDAFAIPTTNRQGTLGRNALRGFGAWQLDVALRRQFKLKEGLNLQFKSDFFNLFNHPNFADPINVLSSGLFGQSTRMLGRSLGGGGASGGSNPLYQIGSPRSIQLAVKLQF